MDLRSTITMATIAAGHANEPTIELTNCRLSTALVYRTELKQPRIPTRCRCYRRAEHSWWTTRTERHESITWRPSPPGWAGKILALGGYARPVGRVRDRLVSRFCPQPPAVDEDIESLVVDDVAAKAEVRALAFTEARARLMAQREDREQIRVRSGAQLTVSVAAASFLVAAAYTREHLDGADLRLWLGLLALVGVAGTHASIYWPRKWIFFSAGRTILEDYSEAGYSLSQTHHYLAAFYTRHARRNEPILACMSKLVAISAGLMIVEVLFLAWFLIGLG
jgi:hypothetical protein